MKILIGTPIHQVKDYCMERWLKNVSELLKVTRAELLLVDNSPGLEYVQKVKEYCNKFKIKNYKIEHLEIIQELGADERIGRSREIIRQEFLRGNYDIWFSWECDQIIPTDGLERLVKLMQKGDYQMVSHGYPARELPEEEIAAFGVTLVSKRALEKYGFLLEYPDMPNCWHAGENWLKKRILKDGGNYIEVYGVIKPIYHLNG